jgi:hypothetical protein
VSDEQTTTTDEPTDEPTGRHHTRPEDSPDAPSDAAGSPSSNGSGDVVPAGTAAGTSADPATQVVDKGALLAASAFAVTDVPLPSGRGLVRVRPLSRAEAMTFYGRELNAAQMECEVLALALVEPKFSVKEVAKWQENSAAGADIMHVVHVVMNLSGMDLGAGKEAYKRFRGTT